MVALVRTHYSLERRAYFGPYHGHLYIYSAPISRLEVQQGKADYNPAHSAMTDPLASILLLALDVAELWSPLPLPYGRDS
jgi:hypothetical protein